MSDDTLNKLREALHKALQKSKEKLAELIPELNQEQFDWNALIRAWRMRITVWNIRNTDTENRIKVFKSLWNDYTTAGYYLRLVDEIRGIGAYALTIGAPMFVVSKENSNNYVIGEVVLTKMNSSSEFKAIASMQPSGNMLNFSVSTLVFDSEIDTFVDSLDAESVEDSVVVSACELLHVPFEIDLNAWF